MAGPQIAHIANQFLSSSIPHFWQITVKLTLHV